MLNSIGRDCLLSAYSMYFYLLFSLWLFRCPIVLISLLVVDCAICVHREIVGRTARLAASWMGVGWVHGNILLSNTALLVTCLHCAVVYRLT